MTSDPTEPDDGIDPTAAGRSARFVTVARLQL